MQLNSNETMKNLFAPFFLLFTTNFQQAESFYEVANSYRSMMSDEIDEVSERLIQSCDI